MLGESEKAVKMANFIASEEPTGWLAASSLHLLGEISGGQGQHVQALVQLGQAHNAFRDLGDKKNQYKTLLGLAEVSLRCGDVNNAREFLHSAERFKTKAGKYLARYYQLCSVLSLTERNYSKGMEQCRLALAEYQALKSESGAAEATSDLGFFQIMNGMGVKGLQTIREADKRFRALGNDRALHYNKINMILGRRCSGQTTGQLVSEVRTQADNSKDLMLSKLLTFALTAECGN